MNENKRVLLISLICFLGIVIFLLTILQTKFKINKVEEITQKNSIIENTTKEKIISEEVIEKSTTHLSSFPKPSYKPTQITSTTTIAPITKVETSSSSNSSFSSASAIAFYYDDGENISISESEYHEICGVVMNETGYGSYEGCVAVAQSIRNQIIREKHKDNPYDISSIRKAYQEHYTKTPNDRVRRAVTDVFYNHIVVTKQPILFWCSGYSSWHAKQVYICSYDGNNFYALPNKDW